MDKENRYATRGTFLLLRLEYLVALVACVLLALMNLGDIDWLRFAILFVTIDLVGYLPGAIAHRRAREGRPISRVYFWLYNLTHSFVFAALVAGVWALLLGPEWALLALPLHLCGDRALFGNLLKSTRFSFEPHLDPALAQLESTLERDEAPLNATQEKQPCLSPST